MILPLPATFNPVLTSERLQMVADWLLEELYATEDDLSLDAVLPISAAAQALAQYTPAHAEAVDAALARRRPDFGDM